MENIHISVCLQEIQYQQAQSSQGPADKFVPVVSQFITMASFSFSEVEESLTEAKELVSGQQMTFTLSHKQISSAFKNVQHDNNTKQSSVRQTKHFHLSNQKCIYCMEGFGLVCSGSSVYTKLGLQDPESSTILTTQTFEWCPSQHLFILLFH